VPKNDAEAAAWFAKAAQQNVPGAQMNYGLLLAKGQGIPADPVEAYKWLNVSAGQGHANAVKNRDLLAATMDRSQIAEAQLRASQFMAKHVRAETRPARGG